MNLSRTRVALAAALAAVATGGGLAATQYSASAVNDSDVPILWVGRTYTQGGPSTWTGSLAALAQENSTGATSTPYIEMVAGAEPHFYDGDGPISLACSTTPVAPDAFSWTFADLQDWAVSDGVEVAWCKGDVAVAGMTVWANYLAAPTVAPTASDRTLTVADGSRVHISVPAVAHSTWVYEPLGRPQEDNNYGVRIVVTQPPSKGVLEDLPTATQHSYGFYFRAKPGATGSDVIRFRVCSGWPYPALAPCSAEHTASITVT